MLIVLPSRWAEEGGKGLVSSPDTGVATTEGCLSQGGRSCSCPALCAAVRVQAVWWESRTALPGFYLETGQWTPHGP